MRETICINKEIKKLVPEFIRIVRHDVQRAKDSLNKGDFQTVGIVAHRLQGDGASYGFNRLSDLGAALKKAAQARDQTTALKYFNYIEDYFDNVDVIFE
ncbi:MAG: Hpt domain-containing protein [Elusimicrobiota bacterium]